MSRQNNKKTHIQKTYFSLVQKNIDCPNYHYDFFSTPWQRLQVSKMQYDGEFETWIYFARRGYFLRKINFIHVHHAVCQKDWSKSSSVRESENDKQITKIAKRWRIGGVSRHSLSFRSIRLILQFLESFSPIISKCDFRYCFCPKICDVHTIKTCELELMRRNIKARASFSFFNWRVRCKS